MSIDNMDKNKAREKMSSLVKSIKTCMFITDMQHKPLHAIPMTTKEVDKEGNIWFLSQMESNHNTDIVKDSDVQLLYSDPSDKEFISIYGKAAISTSSEKLKELYEKTDNAWFTGLDDPNLTAIKVIPEQAYYWDSSQNKYINLLKIGMSAVTGDKKDIGKKGKLNL